MKTLSLITSSLALAAALALSGCGSAQPEAPAKAEPKAQPQAKTAAEVVEVEKVGFLSTKECAAKGAFTDCYLETYSCGTTGCYKNTEPGVPGKIEIVLFSHAEGHTYNVDYSTVGLKELDHGINRNDVTLIGKYNPDTNTIHVMEFKAPPPPKKSFFKGCL
ncbi:MAG: hypothetical protein IE916_01460 [Epsilonproteobacteria bacterium]|nr:hypothetical protein [Campylobacterota bacterium]